MPKNCSIVECKAPCPFSGWNETVYYTGCGVELQGHWAVVEAEEDCGLHVKTWRFCPHCGGRLPVENPNKPTRAKGANQ